MSLSNREDIVSGRYKFEDAKCRIRNHKFEILRTFQLEEKLEKPNNNQFELKISSDKYPNLQIIAKAFFDEKGLRLLLSDYQKKEIYNTSKNTERRNYAIDENAESPIAFGKFQFRNDEKKSFKHLNKKYRW